LLIAGATNIMISRSRMDSGPMPGVLRCRTLAAEMESTVRSRSWQTARMAETKSCRATDFNRYP
jgi:hypothetical protein